MSRARAPSRPRPSVLALCVLAVSWCAPSAAQSPVNPALMQYVRGLDLIRQGKYPEGAEALTQAMQASTDPSFILARGAANCLIPGIGTGREGDTNFGGHAGGGVAAASFVEMAKTALARGECQEASRVMQRATQARFPPEMREEANQLQFAIARCFRDRR